ncbi:hypothetical protein VMCG_08739 [Cytospora schulzeri]|uniref:FAD/NAD(P)-binding domain-containing protein n=1 Tax=Cytospora schulzeri TaxID=448051 RepID=A0A423VQ60_9PEZI|nr:hypothetical protein VMCG_08739 [Valsa malicola]
MASSVSTPSEDATLVDVVILERLEHLSKLVRASTAGLSPFIEGVRLVGELFNNVQVYCGIETLCELYNIGEKVDRFCGEMIQSIVRQHVPMIQRGLKLKLDRVAAQLVQCILQMLFRVGKDWDTSRLCGTMPPVLDVLIIGGGPGGLSAATALARQLYTAAVFDSGVYRNALTKHMHNVPTWDHRDPADFRAAARADLLARYDTISFEETSIESVRQASRGGFEATDARGRTWLARKLVLASGVRDVYPEIEGYEDVWARGVYHCLFCHGYEDRGVQAAGVLAIGDVGNVFAAIHLARMAKRLASQVTIFTDGADDLAQQIVLALGDQSIAVDKRRISKLAKGTQGPSEVIVHFQDGESLAQGFIVHKPKSEINGPFVRQLSLELTEQAVIKTTQPFYESSVKGVFAVGDCATAIPAVTNAMAMGAFAAGGLISQLQSEPSIQSEL